MTIDLMTAHHLTFYNVTSSRTTFETIPSVANILSRYKMVSLSQGGVNHH